MKKGKKTILTTLCLLSMANVLSPMTAFANERKNVFCQEVVAQQNTYNLEMVEDGKDYEEIIVNGNSRVSGSYSSTYDMKGGIITKQSWQTSSTPTFNVDIVPRTYPLAVNPNMTICLEKQFLFTWLDVAHDTVSIQNGGRVTLRGDGAGTYRIHIYNTSNYQTTGDIYINFSY